MNIAVILPAAGTSSRFGEKNKLEEDIHGRAVLMRSVELFVKRPVVSQIIVAVNPDAVDEFKFKWGDRLGFHDVLVVPGGKVERWETVLRAMEAVKDDVTHIAVHDAARPLASGKLIDRIIEAAEQYDAVIPATPVSGTLKKAQALDDHSSKDPLDAIFGDAGRNLKKVHRVVGKVDRTGLFEVQTPQLFKCDLLARAYAQIAQGQIDSQGITDDAGLVEALGEDVYLVEGEVTNLKITRPGDMPLARAIFSVVSRKDEKAEARRKLFAEDDD